MYFRYLLFSLALVFTLCLDPAFARSPHKETSHTQRQQAELYFIQKKFDEAIRLYIGILDKEEGISQDYRWLIKAYEGAGILSDAETLLKSRIQAYPESSPVFYAYGYCLYLQGRDGESEAYLLKALQFDPKNALAMNSLGALKSKQKQYAEAVEQVKRAIAVQPDELFFYQNLKAIYSEMGEAERFAADYRESLAESKTHLKTVGYGKTIAVELRQKGFRYYAEHKLSEAIESFSQMLSIYKEINHSSGVVSALFSLGLLYEETGDEKMAEKYFRELLEINPEHIQAREKIKKTPQ